MKRKSEEGDAGESSKRSRQSGSASESAKKELARLVNARESAFADPGHRRPFPEEGLQQEPDCPSRFPITNLSRASLLAAAAKAFELPDGSSSVGNASPAEVMRHLSVSAAFAKIASKLGVPVPEELKESSCLDEVVLRYLAPCASQSHPVVQ